MSRPTVFAKKITTFTCKECKREWMKLAGDITHPPEECPFCKVSETDQLLAKVSDLRGWLRIYKILRDAHKNHRRTLLAENELLREYITAVLAEALPIIHLHQVRNIDHQAQFPRCKKAWANMPENVRVILEANIPESVGLIREMKPSDDGELLEMEN